MEKTIGMRIRECRVKLGMTQEELAEALLTKKSRISAYENDKIDIKVSILKHIAKILDTSVFYLVGEQDEDIDSEVMKMAMILQQIQSKELRKIAIEQVKVFTFLQ
ncbi:MAG: helix-turn-helix domain-containing protein [Roseburia sp.]